MQKSALHAPLIECRWKSYAWLLAALFAGITSYFSWFRWATFQYASFDLAFYVQGFWECLHGRFNVSLLDVPIMGNHAEPLVFLLIPVFALVPHPMLPVVVQNLALATMAPVGFRIARRAGLAPRPAFLLASAILIAPAAGFVALHEFHPEAFSAPLLLLLFEARQRKSIKLHWIYFLLVLACKENLALLLLAYCGVLALQDWRQRDFRSCFGWAILPAFFALSWFLAYSRIISPALNGGDVDYAALYAHLGQGPAEIVLNFVRKPSLALGAICRALREGNLFWLLLLPYLFLPLLRPRWLLVAAPLLLQHLLSWRTSEWSISYHYSAPLIPVFWMATMEAVAYPSLGWSQRDSLRKYLPPAIATVGAVVALFAGPVRGIIHDMGNSPAAWTRAGAGYQMLSQIPPDVSVTAPIPYLSHLALRSELYSLHHVIKGLKTLSRERYSPPSPSKIVLVDYDDVATFNRAAGFYHPNLFGKKGEKLPSSDTLLHDYLTGQPWKITRVNALTLYRTAAPVPEISSARPPAKSLVTCPDGTRLLRVKYPKEQFLANGLSELITLEWEIPDRRTVLPWAFLRVEGRERGKVHLYTKGLCLPEAVGGVFSETWHFILPSEMAAGSYAARLVLVDMPTLLWRGDASLEPPIPATLLGTVELGSFKSPPD